MIKSRYKGIYIVPTAITYINMVFGILAIFISLGGGYENIKKASLFIILAGLADKLDGFVARKFKISSDFGAELDSFCDLVSFGLAPMIVAWNFGLVYLGSQGVLAALVYVGACIFRLSRFNLEEEGDQIRGLPSTLAGLVLALKFLLDLGLRMGRVSLGSLLREDIILINLLALLMVASFQFNKPNIIDRDLF